MERINLKPILGGLLAIAAYVSLFEAVGFRAEQNQPFYRIGWRESYFWLAHYCLAVPGLLLIVAGVAESLGAGVLSLATRLSTVSSGTWAGLGLVFFALLFAASALGRHVLLLDIPVTADEQGVLFGGRALAEGFLRVPTPEPRAALPLYYLYIRDGFASSFDFPGSILFSAFSLITGTGALAYSLLAALSGLAVVLAAGLLAGRKGSLAAACIWLLSPMVLSLSYTTHGQLLSRSFCAFAFLFYCRLVCSRQRPSRRLAGALDGLGLGLAAGLAFLCRPIEASCLLAPLAIHLGLLAVRHRELIRPWAVAALSWSVSAAVFAWHNWETTGRWYLQARFSPQFGNKYNTDQSLADLLGTNTGFNYMMLIIWFLGPVGLALVYPVLGRSPVTTALASGVGLQLLVGLFHPDTGIHLVGPIHYSECAVPLTLLAVLGLYRLFGGQTAFKLPRPRLAAFSVAYLVSLGLFNAVHSLTLREQAEIQRVPFEAVEEAGIDHAVVIAQPPHRLWDMRPEMAEVRTWVATWPLPDPFLRDKVLFVHPYLEAEELAGWFPDRRLYLMTYREQGEPIRIEPLLRPGG